MLTITQFTFLRGPVVALFLLLGLPGRAAEPAPVLPGAPGPGRSVSLPQLPVRPLPTRWDAVVSTEKGAGFATLQAAVDAAPEKAAAPYVILVKAGRYRWQQTLIPATKPNLVVVGEDPNRTFLSFHLNVYETPKLRHLKGQEGISLIVLADDFRAENLTIENISGDHGQALALRLDGDRAVVRNCRLLGWQDTLMVNNGRDYFEACYIEGRVDFIYGSATAVFDRCEIRSRNGGYITAASTPADRKYGLVFRQCRLTSDPLPWDPEDPGKRNARAYLGRPWRPFAQVAFVECEMGEHIRAEGWHNWRNPENEKTARYVEYRCTGPGAATGGRVAWCRQLGDDEAQEFAADTVLAGADGWRPAQ